MRTIAVDFAMRHSRRRDEYSAAARAEIERVWPDSLVAAKLLNRDPSLARDTPALSWLNIMKDLDAAAVLTAHAKEIQALRTSLGV